MQPLGALAHLDFNLAARMATSKSASPSQLGLQMASAEQQFRRMLFNVVARNQDDHVKNIAFLMNKAARTLAPAFDVTYSYNRQDDGRAAPDDDQRQATIRAQRIRAAGRVPV
jgi:serine/threonine-protein kinase HipA